HEPVWSHVQLNRVVYHSPKPERDVEATVVATENNRKVGTETRLGFCGWGLGVVLVAENLAWLVSALVAGDLVWLGVVQVAEDLAWLVSGTWRGLCQRRWLGTWRGLCWVAGAVA
ncbi:hypothetical protein F444_15280, partial [Phytophthora nicotianae P1976]